jgi:hypothetical protein
MVAIFLRLRPTQHGEAIKTCGKVASPISKGVVTLKPEWVKGKTVLRSTSNGKKLQRMGTFREEIKRERLSKMSTKPTDLTLMNFEELSGEGVAMPDIVKIARHARKV